MNSISPKAYHTVQDEWLAAYSAGQLSDAKRLLLDCQAAINPKLGSRLNKIDMVGGALLETAKGEAMSDNFMSGVFNKIDRLDAAAQTYTKVDKKSKNIAEDWVPAPLNEFLGRAGIPLKWKKMGFGMERLPIYQDGNEKLYLLKSRSGLKMPHHSHYGDEWALILQGGYKVGDQGYVRGDLHAEDESCRHGPVVDDHGEACITLVASIGGLKFTNPALRLLKPILGV